MRKATAFKFLGLVAATSVLSLNLFAGSSSAASNSIDITGLFEFNECTAEPVVLEGRVHVFTTTTPNDDGTYHVKVHSNTQGVKGEGLVTLDDYVFNTGVNIQGEFDVVAGGTGHMVGHEIFIHPGEFGGFPTASEDDKHVHFNIAVGIDIFGEPITTFIPTVECK